MVLKFEGAGGVVAPAPNGPIGRIMQRVMNLRDVSPTPEVLQAAELLTTLTKAEDAARQGLHGDLLNRLIVHLANLGNPMSELQDVLYRVRQLQPAVNDSGYV